MRAAGNPPLPVRSQAAGILLPRTLLLATDLQRTILAELDGSGLNSLAWTAYGSQSNPSTAGTHLGFNGQLRERPFGWYHLGNGHRVYNPVLMRFHSADRLSPFGKGGLNAYAYCAGDPINFEDPTGQFFTAISRLIGAFETMAGRLDTIAGVLFRSRPTGLLGYAAFSSNAGYAGLAAGATMQAAGYSVGAVVSNVGAALVSAGNGVRAAHSAVNVVRRSRFGRRLVQRIAGRAPTVDLVEVIVRPGTGNHTMARVSTPAVTSGNPAEASVHSIRKGQ
jgi:RHS repeat-associated protein